MAGLRLHNFFRNSAGHRVRIALALKGLDYDYVSVNIGAASEQKSESYLRLNPQGLVPALEHKGAVITQSSAIIEYLEEVFPDPSLLPADPLTRARARAFASAIAAEMHALNNSGVHRYLASEMGLDEEKRQSWYAHWAQKGFSALEARRQTDDRGYFPCAAARQLPALRDRPLALPSHQPHRGAMRGAAAIPGRGAGSAA